MNEALSEAHGNPRLIGHEDAIAAFMQAAASRLHHAWLIHGTEGIGKASFAFHCANYLLSEGRQKIGALDVQERNYRLIAGGAHPDLKVLERPVDPKTGVMKEEIPIDQVRDLTAFFQLTSSHGGWRIAIVKRADALNRNAANALLKILEEPPPRSLILMTAVTPGKLLPTIRSRCRPLRLSPLDDAQMNEVLGDRLAECSGDDAKILHRMAQGSPGRALDILAHDGLEIYRDFLNLLQTSPRERNAALLRFTGSGKVERERFNLIARFCEDWLVRLRHMAATGEAQEIIPGEGQLMRRMAVKPLAVWFDVAENCGQQFALAQTASLDRRLIMLNNLQQILAAAA
ncbi:MAG: DNA polymerase III subunit delta' [Alphaproteobacteria bacterium]